MRNVLFFSLILSFFSSICTQTLSSYDLHTVRTALVGEAEFVRYDQVNNEIVSVYKFHVEEILKGDRVAINSFYLYTLGGVSEDGDIISYSHMPILKNRQKYVYVTESNFAPLPSQLVKVDNNIYEIFQTSDLNAGVRSVQTDESIEYLFTEFKNLLLSDGSSSGDRNCIVFTLLPTPYDETESKIYADILVSTSLEPAYLKSTDFKFKYSTLWFGQNIALNGAISLTPGAIVNSSYQLSVTDVDNDKVTLDINSNTVDTTELKIINTEPQLLATVELDVSSIANEYPIDLIDINDSSFDFYIDVDENILKNFSCSRLVIDTRQYGEISSFNVSPTTVAAGLHPESLNIDPVLGFVTLIGDNFGEPDPGDVKPGNRRIKFRTVDGGWISPFDSDYISWSDNEIVVKVPVIGFNNNGSNILNDPNGGSSANGIVRFCPNGICFPERNSNQDLTVRYTTRNVLNNNTPGNPINIPVALRGYINGGYKYTLRMYLKILLGQSMHF